MKIIKQFLIILIFTFTGELIAYFLPFSFPGTIIGLLLFFIALVLNIVKIEHVKEVATWLQNNMGFMFIPLAVGIMQHFEILKLSWLELLVTLFVTTILTIIITSLIVDKGAKKNEWVFK